MGLAYVVTAKDEDAEQELDVGEGLVGEEESADAGQDELDRLRQLADIICDSLHLRDIRAVWCAKMVVRGGRGQS